MIKISNNFEQIKQKHLKELKAQCILKIKNLKLQPMSKYQTIYFEVLLNNIDKLLIGEKPDLDYLNNSLKYYTNFKNIINEYKSDESGKGSRKRNKNNLINFIENNFSFLNIKIKETSLSNIRKEAIKKIEDALDYNFILEKTKEIFNYDEFTKNKIWGRYKVMSSLNISVCPYCNRQYITNYGEDNINKTTADLDHYYPKSKYPYLALSLYNFIPSCQICNSRMKSDKEGHLYPYDEGFEDKAIFRTNETSVNAILNSNKDKIKVSIEIQVDKFTDEEKNNGFKNRLNKSISKVFKLDKVYETSHNKYIYDMLETIEKYPDSYLDSIAEFFIKDKEMPIEKLKIKTELKELIKKPYIDRIERGDTLSKLIEDILKEFRIIK